MSSLRQQVADLQALSTEQAWILDEIQRGEALVTSIVQLAADAIIMIDEAQKIVFFNLGAEQIFGYPSQEVIGLPLDILLPERFQDLHRKHVARFSTAGEQARFMKQRDELVGRRKNGEEFPAEATISQHQTHHQKTLTVILRDNTERKQTQEELARERELNELKSRFVSMVSHEFRTPLAIISSTAGILLNHSHHLSEPQQRTRMETIQTQVTHLADLLNDILLISRAEQVGLEFHPANLDIEQLCRHTVQEQQSLAGDSHHISFSAQGECVAFVGDRQLLLRLFNNLISNAMKYSPDGGPVDVDLACDAQAVVITIRDEGLGIPEADQKHLFEPFHRAENVGTIPGTGLGLSIIKQVVEAHSGTIEFESQPEQGTTFRITLPLIPPS